MSITPFPSQGQYPWYDQLEQWGTDTQAAAENAKVAANQVHADVAGAVADAQAAQVAATNAANLVGAPAGEVVRTVVEGDLGATSSTIGQEVRHIADSAAIYTQDFDGAATTASPSSPVPGFNISPTVSASYPSWLSRDRKTMFSIGSKHVRYSTDNGSTWTGNDNPLPEGTQAIRDLADGEILVSAGISTGKLYKSVGWATNKKTATFVEVLTASGSNIYFHNGYSLWVDPTGIVLAGEYGSKVAEANARYVYLSKDFGSTWETILDIGGTLETHVHGVAYDKWWKRIWVSRGDASGAIFFSDDMGESWTTVTRYESPQKCQVTTIHPMQSAVLFLSDSPPNGVLRVRRQSRDNPLVEVAHRLNSASSITHIGQMAYQADVPGAPALLSFSNDPAGGAGSTGPGRLLATLDGFKFWELWTDTIDYGGFGGLTTCVGPTTGNEYRGTLIDGRQATYSLLRINAPKWSDSAVSRPRSAYGDETMPRISAVSEPVLVSGELALSYFQASLTQDVTRISAYTASTAAAATATLFRLGLYEVDGSQGLRLIGAGVSDVSKIQGTYASAGQDIQARVTAGRLYAIGMLAVGPGQMPTLAGIQAGSGSKLPSGLFFTEPKLSARVPATTDLPTEILTSSLQASGKIFWHALLSS